MISKRGRPRNLENSDLKRGEILAAATKAFAQFGYDKTDVGAIAEQIGYSKGSIYYYFENKEDLFLGCVDWMMQKLLETIQKKIELISDELLSIEVAIEAYLVFFDEHPSFVELLIQERAIFKTREKPTYFKYREQSLTQWQMRYQRLMTSGRLRQMPVESIMDCIGDLLYGAVFTNYFSGRNKPMRQHARDIIEVVWKGILSEDEKVSRLRQEVK